MSGHGQEMRVKSQRIFVLNQHETSLIALQAAHEAGDVATFHCDSLRLMSLANIDPSLAIGFYCRSPG